MAKSHRKAPSVDLAKIVGDVLNEYRDEVERSVAKIIPDVAEDVVQELHTSPTPILTGDYAKGWTYTQETSAFGRVSVKVHNKTDWQLTHLLEWGHALKRGGREIGRVQAYPHIKQRNDNAEKLLMKKVEDELK